MVDSGSSSGHDHETRAVFGSDRAVDTYTDRASAGLLPQEQAILDRYLTSDDGRVLDLGCGTGRTTRALRDRGFEVVGVDLSVAMVEQANELDGELELSVADATALPFASESFAHVIFSNNGLDYAHPVSQRQAALAEIRRVLRPGGCFVFSSVNSWYALPALLLGDGAKLRERYLDHGNFRRLFRPYKLVDNLVGRVRMYQSNPLKQRRQLQQAGFELLEVVGKRESIARLLEAKPHYVVRKPP